MEIFLGNMAYFLKEESKNVTSLYPLQYQKMPREAKSSMLNTGGMEAGVGGDTRICDNPPTFRSKDGKYVPLICSSLWQTLLVHTLSCNTRLLAATTSEPELSAHTSETCLPSLFDTVYMAKWSLPLFSFGFFFFFFKLLLIQPRVFFTWYYSLFSMRSISILNNLLVRYFSNF